MLNFALLLVLLSRAQATVLPPSQVCRLALSGDERFEQLKNHPGSALKIAAGVSRLMSEAWWPVMRATERMIKATPPREIVALAREWGPKLDLKPFHDYPGVEVSSRLDHLNQQGLYFDRVYDLHYEIRSHWDLHLKNFDGEQSRLHFPFFDHNREFIKRVTLVSALMLLLIDREAEKLGEAFPEDARRVLRERSYTQDDAGKGLYLGIKSLGQALAWVTGSPVAGLSPIELARRASVEGSEVSIVEQLALRLPPGLLGLYGDSYFLSQPVEIDANGHLGLTERMNQFLRDAREARSAPEVAAVFHLGTGCPVALPSLEPGARTGLGLALDLFWYIYDQVYPQRRSIDPA